MYLLALLVEWADGNVSDLLRKDISPEAIILRNNKKLPLGQIVRDGAPVIQTWLQEHPEYEIDMMDLFHNYWEIAFVLKLLGLEEIYIFYHSPQAENFETDHVS